MGVPIIYKYSYASVFPLFTNIHMRQFCFFIISALVCFDDRNSSAVFSELILTFYILPLVGYATIFYCEIWHLRVFE